MIQNVVSPHYKNRARMFTLRFKMSRTQRNVRLVGHKIPMFNKFLYIFLNTKPEIFNPLLFDIDTIYQDSL